MHALSKVLYRYLEGLSLQGGPRLPRKAIIVQSGGRRGISRMGLQTIGVGPCRRISVAFSQDMS